MNIVYIHRTRGEGVEGVHIDEIVRQFVGFGHRVEIVCPVEPDEAGGNRRNQHRDVGRKLPEFLFEIAELAYNLLGYYKLARLAQRDDVDLIYERYAIFSVFGVFFARRRRVPIVIEANYTAELPLVRRRTKLLKPLARRLDRYIFAGATRIVAVSSFVRDHLVEFYRVDPDKIRVVPNAADPDKFRFVDRDLGDDPKTIGFVGGFYPWHDVGLLVSAFAELAAEHPAARLCLVGDGPERPAIEAQVADLGIADAVEFTGSVPHGELAERVAPFYVGVMPDSNLYGSPMKIFEYMSMGVPVVAPDYAPILDVVRDAHEGLIFRRRDRDDLVACLRRILASPQLRRDLSLRARNKIETDRNWENNARLSIENL